MTNLTASSASEKLEELANHDCLSLAEKENANIEFYHVLHGRLNAINAALAAVHM